jgi:hypothetical protein
LNRRSIEIPECIGLDAIGEDAEQKMLGHVLWGRAPHSTPPAALQADQIETAQMRNLVLQ